MNFKISVIIPCYNGFKYMEKCFKMLEAQTEKPYEVIIADDCSTDDSFKKLQEYQKSSNLNIVLLKNEVNCGPGISRKKAIDIALGDYIAFCDCDDWFESDFFETVNEKLKLKEADVLIFDNYVAYEDRRIVANTVLELAGKSKKEIIANIRMSLCRLAVKKEIMQSVVCPPLYYGEDGAVVPQIIAKAQSIEIIDKPLYNYYYREGSVSQKPSIAAYTDLIKAFCVVKAELPKEYFDEYEFIGIKCVCYGAVLNAFKAGAGIKAVKSILNDFEKDFPKWFSNKYRKNLGKIKNLYLFFIKYRMFLLVKLMSLLHNFYFKFRRN